MVVMMMCNYGCRTAWTETCSTVHGSASSDAWSASRTGVSGTDRSAASSPTDWDFWAFVLILILIACLHWSLFVLIFVLVSVSLCTEYTMPRKNCADLFLSEPRQISTDFNNLWQVDGKMFENLRGVFISHLTWSVLPPVLFSWTRTKTRTKKISNSFTRTRTRTKDVQKNKKWIKTKKIETELNKN